jgi:hypothetical protein
METVKGFRLGKLQDCLLHKSGKGSINNPKPPKKHSVDKRLRLSGRRKAVTVCIAGIKDEGRTGQSSILLVCDRRISLLGGWFSQEGNAKYTPVHRDWFGMFAGAVEETNLILKAVNKSLAKLKATPFERVVKQCQATYRNIREMLIETQILPEFDIRSYQEFKQLEKEDEAFYLRIKAKITTAEEDWTLLFAGFDEVRAPHLFVISGPGRVEYCDHQKVAAIGSGSFAALFWLAFYGYHPQRSLGELLFGAISAKFYAERAHEVGPTTVVSTIKSDVPALFHFNPSDVSMVRRFWDAMPKFDEATTKLFEQQMQQVYQATRQQLAVQTSKRER